MFFDALTTLVVRHGSDPDVVATEPIAPPRDVAEVYERHFDYVYRCLRHLGVWEGSLDDAAQDVFLVVHAKLGEFDGGVPLTTWLYAVVIRVARRYRERQGRARRQESDEQLSHARTPERAAETNRKLSLARRALDELDEEKREVFVLSDVHQLSAQEVAAITGAPLNTVYSRLRVAREQFARASRRLVVLKRAP